MTSRSAAASATDSAARRLVDLIGYGGTTKDYVAAESLGFKKTFERQLNPGAIQDRKVEGLLAYCPNINRPILDLLSLSPGVGQADLQEATVLRAAFSERSLLEKMVEFWHDHFNVDLGKTNVYKLVFDRDVIRPRALGKFGDLLRATLYSPAMLHYLDNWESWWLDPNQNYARELMELHTLGVNGGYTQQDVIEVARCLTGHTFYSEASAGNLRGQYYYDDFKHDNGPKVVLGDTIAAGGRFLDAERVLDLLIEHPSTAEFVSKKLCIWFLGETVSQSVIDRATVVFKQSGGDTASVLRVILTKENVLNAPMRVRRPFHYVAGALRRLEPFIFARPDTRFALSKMGMPVHSCSPPSGYSMSDSYWVSALLPRWNFAIALLTDQIAGVSVNVEGILGTAGTAQPIVDQIDRVLFDRKMSAALKSQLVAYIGQDSLPRLRARDALAMALAAPEQQLY